MKVCDLASVEFLLRLWYCTKQIIVAQGIFGKVKRNLFSPISPAPLSPPFQRIDSSAMSFTFAHISLFLSLYTPLLY